MYRVQEEYKRVKLHTQKKSLHNWSLPLLVSGLTPQQFHLKCSTEDTELRTGLRPQIHKLHPKLHSKALSKIRCISVSTQLISSALTTPPMKKSDAEKLVGDMAELMPGL